MNLIFDRIEKDNNFAAWRGDAKGKSKQTLVNEVTVMLEDAGITIQAKNVRANLFEIFRSFNKAMDWKAQTGNGWTGSSEEQHTIQEKLNSMCPGFDRLYPLMADRASSTFLVELQSHSELEDFDPFLVDETDVPEADFREASAVLADVELGSIPEQSLPSNTRAERRFSPAVPPSAKRARNNGENLADAIAAAAHLKAETSREQMEADSQPKNVVLKRKSAVNNHSQKRKSAVSYDS